MSWLRIDDGFAEHPKIIDLSHKAFRLHVTGLCYCARNLTDGYVSSKTLRVLHAIVGSTKRNVAELVDAGVWDLVDTGHQVSDYLDYNPSADEIKAIRESNRRRTALSRDQELRQSVRNRDGDNCRYCGREVHWNDRRGPAGATYDHIDPDGPNSLENLVVACRACNSGKGHRTPEQAGLVLSSVPKSEPGSDSDYVARTRESHPIPSQGLVPKEEPLPSNAARKEGSDESSTDTDFGTLRRLLALIPAKGREEARRKVIRTVQANHSSEADLIAAIEAAAGSNVRDPIAVILSTLKKRAAQKGAAA